MSIRNLVVAWVASSAALIAGCASQNQAPEYLIEDGERAYRANDFRTAAQQLTTYLSGEPSSAEAYRAQYVRGMAYAKLGDRPHAQQDLERAARQQQDPEIAWRAAAAVGVLYFEDGAWQPAVEHLSHATSAMPTVPPLDAYLYRLGIAYERSGRWGDALAAYRRIVSTLPNGRYGATAARRLMIEADHFTVQAGLFSRRESADQLAKRLRGAGLPASVRPESRDGTTYNAVMVGEFSNYTAAVDMLGRVRAYIPDAQLWP